MCPNTGKIPYECSHDDHSFRTCISRSELPTCRVETNDEENRQDMNNDEYRESNSNNKSQENKRQEFSVADHILKRDFKRAIDRANSHPHELRQLCLFSDGTSFVLPLHLSLLIHPLPPYSLIKVLIEHYPKAVKMKEGVWGYLPLHLACRFDVKKNRNKNKETKRWVCSDDNHERIVNSLLEVYPKAAREKETFRGMLPIHLAVEANATARVVELLIKAYPNGVMMKDNFGETPIDFAKRSVKLTPQRLQVENLIESAVTNLARSKSNSDEEKCGSKDTALSEEISDMIQPVKNGCDDDDDGVDLKESRTDEDVHMNTIDSCAAEVQVNEGKDGSKCGNETVSGHVNLWKKMEKQLKDERERMRDRISSRSISLSVMKQLRRSLKCSTKLLTCCSVEEDIVEKPYSDANLSKRTVSTNRTDESSL
mmetsp:Transcript_29488/g.35911  ORF Transcript_29488/g.35911 Transcript_29488/m.35911 type:complete len:426 (-) Transcript_29488:139-1416(-)